MKVLREVNFLFYQSMQGFVAFTSDVFFTSPPRNRYMQIKIGNGRSRNINWVLVASQSY